MPDLVDTLIEDNRWDVAGLAELAGPAAVQTLQFLGFDPAGYEISLLGCDDARIAVLNADFRDKPSPTNVLSWPADELAADTAGGTPKAPEADFPDMPVELGDIAISYDTCAREAAETSKPFAAHVTHLVVHGVLHLLGYDHIDDADAVLMEGIETQVLAEMGLPDPY